jgi:uncharacterized protein (TIGR00251 family)
MAAPSRIRLRVTPGAARSRVVGRHGDGWKVRVAAPAENGKANDVLVRLLAGWLGLPRTGVELVSGHTRRDKIVELSGIDEAEARRRLATAEEAR